MYCSSCGAEFAPGLSYCNRCGAELNAKESVPGTVSSGPAPNFLIVGIFGVTTGGLFATAALIEVMKQIPDFPAAWIMAVVFLDFLLILAADSLFAMLLLRSKRPHKEVGPEERTTQELSQRTAPALPEPTFSVTEHTTRTLDPVNREREPG